MASLQKPPQFRIAIDVRHGSSNRFPVVNRYFKAAEQVGQLM